MFSLLFPFLLCIPPAPVVTRLLRTAYVRTPRNKLLNKNDRPYISMSSSINCSSLAMMLFASGKIVLEINGYPLSPGPTVMMRPYRGSPRLSTNSGIHKKSISHVMSRNTNRQTSENTLEFFDKYTVDCRGNYGEMKRATQEVVDGVSGILLKYKRQSLSKKFPRSLFMNTPGVLESGKSLFK